MAKHDKLTSLLDELGSTIRESAGERSKPARPKLVPVPDRATAPTEVRNEGGYHAIPIERIATHRQHRKHFDQGALQELAASILELGMIEPVIVRWNELAGVYDLVAGERRYRAAQMAKLEAIPARIMQLTNAEVAEVQLAENLAREDLNAIELAQAFRDVMEQSGRTARELAKRVGVNETTVTRSIRLLKLPEDIQDQVAKGEVSPRVAREVARLEVEKTQRAVLAHDLTAPQVEHLVRTVVGQKRANSKPHRKGKESGPRRRSFVCREGTVIVIPNRPTYDDAVLVLEEAICESRHRAKNNVQF